MRGGGALGKSSRTARGGKSKVARARTASAAGSRPGDRSGGVRPPGTAAADPLQLPKSGSPSQPQQALPPFGQPGPFLGGTMNPGTSAAIGANFQAAIFGGFGLPSTMPMFASSPSKPQNGSAQSSPPSSIPKAFGFGLQQSTPVTTALPAGEAQMGGTAIPPASGSFPLFGLTKAANTQGMFSFGQSGMSPGADVGQASANQQQAGSATFGSSVSGSDASPGALPFGSRSTGSHAVPQPGPTPIIGFSAPTLAGLGSGSSPSSTISAPTPPAGAFGSQGTNRSPFTSQGPANSGLNPFGFGAAGTSGPGPASSSTLGAGDAFGKRPNGEEQSHWGATPPATQPFPFGSLSSKMFASPDQAASTAAPASSSRINFGSRTAKNDARGPGLSHNGPPPSWDRLSSLPSSSAGQPSSAPALFGSTPFSFGGAPSKRDASGPSSPRAEPSLSSGGPPTVTTTEHHQAVLAAAPAINPFGFGMSQAKKGASSPGSSLTGGPSGSGGGSTPQSAGVVPPAQTVPATTRPEPAPSEDTEAEAVPDGDPVMGTLEEMGHPSEATERPSDPFERDIPADRSTVNPSLLVKYYKRGKQLDPRFIRTKQALRKTQDHLRKLLDTSGAPLVQLYPFIDDRNKALQGDYAIQHMQNLDVMFWIAEHVRFGIMCGHELSELAADANTHQGFNQVLNTTQINNGLTSLSEQFAAARSRGILPPPELEAEMRSYQIQMAERLDLQKVMANSDVGGHPGSQWLPRAIELKEAVLLGSPAEFFKIIRSAPYHTIVLCHALFPSMRCLFLTELSATCEPPGKESALPLSYLVKQMWLDDEQQAAQLAHAAGFEVNTAVREFMPCRGFAQRLATLPATDGCRLVLQANTRSRRLSAMLQRPLSANTAQPAPGAHPQHQQGLQAAGPAAGCKFSRSWYRQPPVQAAGLGGGGLPAGPASAQGLFQDAQGGSGHGLEAGRSPGHKAKRGRAADSDAVSEDGARKRAADHEQQQQQLRVQQERQAEAAARQQQAREDEVRRKAAAEAAAAHAKAAREAAAKRAEAAQAAAARAQQEGQAAARRQQIQAQQHAQARNRKMSSFRQLMTMLRVKYAVEDWREAVEQRKQQRQKDEQHRLAGLAAMSVAGPYLGPSPGSAVVSYTRHDAWRFQPDPATLDASTLDLPSILGPVLAAASPGTKQLFSKLLLAHAAVQGPEALAACWLRCKFASDWTGKPNRVDLVSEHSTLPSDQTLWTSVHDISCILSSAATHATRAEQLQHRPEPPDLQVANLRALAWQCWQERRGKVLQTRVRWQGPEDWREGFNAALTDAARCIRAMGESVAAVWRWPPPECASHEAYHQLPSQWHTPGNLAWALQTLARTHLLAWDELCPAHAGNLDTVTAYFQKVALVAVPGRRAGPWQDAMNDGCAARLGTLPQSPAVMLLERPEHPAASEILSPGRPDSGQHWSTMMGRPQLRLPGPASSLANGSEAAEVEQLPDWAPSASPPKRGVPKLAAHSSPAKRRRFVEDDTAMDESGHGPLA
ncbi:hypothetical protein WJX84_006849 [Apatococcus fuscideae]|uniref:SAC3/GANP/THP3 conserved domain-containing protein n=1 Tax=Apatococcus fuscideae TaxID=2026836 RepID=A0AAW1SYG3_9CHLO